MTITILRQPLSTPINEILVLQMINEKRHSKNKRLMQIAIIYQTQIIIHPGSEFQD